MPFTGAPCLALDTVSKVTKVRLLAGGYMALIIKKG